MKLFKNITQKWGDLVSPVSNETFKVVVLCVVTATTFWFFNALNDNYTTRISYPIKFNYPDSGLVVVTELPDNVKINVSGGGWNLLRKTFWFTIDPVEINLENPVTDKFFLGAALYPNIADQMNEIQLNFIETDTLWVDIDSAVSHTAYVKIDSTNIQLAPNFKIISPIRSSVDSVSFTGPKRFIDNIPDTLLISLKSNNIEKDYNEDISFSTYGSSLVNRNPVETEISFKVAKFIEQELMLPYKVLNKEADSANYVFMDQLATLKFEIQESLANQYSLDSFKIHIDFAKLQPNDSLVLPTIEKTPKQIDSTKIKILPIEYLYQEKK